MCGLTEMTLYCFGTRTLFIIFWVFLSQYDSLTGIPNIQQNLIFCFSLNLQFIVCEINENE